MSLCVISIYRSTGVPQQVLLLEKKSYGSFKVEERLIY